MYKENYENEFLDQEIVIDEALADRLDGRCFIDTNNPDRIEGFKFLKTKNGIDCIHIGAGPASAYDHVLHENYGTYKVGDTYFGIDIIDVETGLYIIKEITDDVFSKMIDVVNEQDEIVKKNKEQFKKKHEDLFRMAKLR